MIIDSHAHFIPPRLLEAIQDSAGDFPALELFPDGKGSFGFAFAGNNPTRPASKMLSDTKGRLDWMDSHGIDLQVIGGWLDMFGYEMPVDQGRQWASMINQHLKEFCAQNDRFCRWQVFPCRMAMPLPRFWMWHIKTVLRGR